MWALQTKVLGQLLPPLQVAVLAMLAAPNATSLLHNLPDRTRVQGALLVSLLSLLLLIFQAILALVHAPQEPQEMSLLPISRVWKPKTVFVWPATLAAALAQELVQLAAQSVPLTPTPPSQPPLLLATPAEAPAQLAEPEALLLLVHFLAQNKARFATLTATPHAPAARALPKPAAPSAPSAALPLLSLL